MRRDIDCALVIDPLGDSKPSYILDGFEDADKFVLNRLDDKFVVEQRELDQDGYLTVPLLDCDDSGNIGRCGAFHTDPIVLKGIETLLTRVFLDEKVPVFKTIDIIDADKRAGEYLAKGCSQWGYKSVYHNKDDKLIADYLAKQKNVPKHVIANFHPEHRHKLPTLPENRIIFSADAEYLGVLPCKRGKNCFGAFVVLKNNVVAIDIK